MWSALRRPASQNRFSPLQRDARPSRKDEDCMKRVLIDIPRLGLRFLLPVVLLVVAATSVNAAYDIPLSVGWNLVSLPEQQSRVAIGIVAASIEGKYESIWTQTDNGWLMYDPAAPGLSDLDSMDAGRAYWIYMNQVGRLVGAGLVPSSTLSIQPGWNFIGYNSSTPRSVSAFLGASPSPIQSIWGWDGTRWHSYDILYPGLSDLPSVEPGKGYWVKASAAGTVSIDVVIPPTTKVIIPALLPQVVSVTSSQIVFASSSSFAASLVVGDTLAAQPFALAPAGLLRKVTGIQLTAAGREIATSDGVLSSAIQTGAVGGTFTGTVQSPQLSSKPGITVTQNVETSRNRNVNVILGGRDYTVDGVTVSLEGEIIFDPKFLFNVEIPWFTLNSFTCAFTGQLQGTVEARAALGHDFALASWTITSIPFSPICGSIGILPVCFVPQVDIIATLNGRLEVSLSAKVGARATATVGFGYLKANGWRFITDAQFATIFEPPSLATLDASVSVKLSVGPAVSVYLYDLAGPQLKLALFGEVARNLASPPLEIFIGLEHEEKFAASDVTTRLLGILGIAVSPQNSGTNTFIKARVYPPSTGFVNGHVSDSSGNALPGVTVTAAGSDPSGGLTPEYTTVSTSSSGDYSLQLRPGLYPTIRFVKAGYESETLLDTVVQADISTTAPSIRMSPIGALGNFGGTIVNAVNGQPVPVATIKFRKGVSAYTTGIMKVVTTTSAGVYLASDLEPGYYTGEMSAAGYNTGYLTALCLSGATNGNQNGVLSPVLDESEIRIVLTWGATPSDLDSHLTGPIEGSTTSRFHVYAYVLGSLTFSPWAALDHDDRYSYGPETITIVRKFPGVYRYSVHDFSNRNATSSTILGNSGAHVDVYRGSSLWQSFNVPNAAGTLWTVFEYSGGAIAPVNSMSYQSDLNTVQSRTPGGSEGDVVTALPKER